MSPHTGFHVVSSLEIAAAAENACSNTMQQYDARNIGGGLNWRSSLPLLATRDESLSPEEFSPRQFDSKPPQAGLAILEAAGRFPAHAGYWICLSRAMNDIYLRPARKVFG